MGKPGNVFLIGPMGAGKSTVGRCLAGLLHKTFKDSDQEIERRSGVSVTLIFELEGEAGFRRRETAMIEELTATPDLVLATGGGAVLAEANRRTLRTRGTVVYLHAPIDILVERTQRDRSRPLLEGQDRRAKLTEIMAVREPLYRATADIVMVTDHRPTLTVAQEIVVHLEAIQAHAHPHA